MRKCSCALTLLAARERQRTGKQLAVRELRKAFFKGRGKKMNAKDKRAKDDARELFQSAVARLGVPLGCDELNALLDTFDVAKDDLFERISALSHAKKKEPKARRKSKERARGDDDDDDEEDSEDKEPRKEPRKSKGFSEVTRRVRAAVKGEGAHGAAACVCVVQ